MVSIVSVIMEYQSAGAMFRALGSCNFIVYHGFILKQACTGMENSLTECGGVYVYNYCPCSAVTVITCRPIATGKTSQ